MINTVHASAKDRLLYGIHIFANGVCVNVQ